MRIDRPGRIDKAHPAVQCKVLPKARYVEEVARVTAALPGRALLRLVETAVGMNGARALAKAHGVQRLVFCSLDFQADLDMRKKVRMGGTAMKPASIWAFSDARFRAPSLGSTDHANDDQCR